MPTRCCVLGEDVLATAPLVALALRQAARGKAFDMTRENNVPEWQAEVGCRHRAARDAIRSSSQHRRQPASTTSPARRCASRPTQSRNSASPLRTRSTPPRRRLDVERRHARSRTQIADALRAAKRPLIVSGTGLGSTAVIQAAANVAWALHKQSTRRVLLSLAVPEANSLGVALFDAPALEDALARVGRRRSRGRRARKRSRTASAARRCSSRCSPTRTSSCSIIR